jgi:hypothetical protein
MVIYTTLMLKGTDFLSLLAKPERNSRAVDLLLRPKGNNGYIPLSTPGVVSVRPLSIILAAPGSSTDRPRTASRFMSFIIRVVLLFTRLSSIQRMDQLKS